VLCCAVLHYLLLLLLQGVVVDGEENVGARGVQLLRVPSAVRELLPSKPYVAPDTNPLPGAETEPDCCSICLVELEAGEHVTVLPCMHFYHKVSSAVQRFNCIRTASCRPCLQWWRVHRPKAPGHIDTHTHSCAARHGRNIARHAAMWF
jgi:hypothetical protein